MVKKAKNFPLMDKAVVCISSFMPFATVCTTESLHGNSGHLGHQHPLIWVDKGYYASINRHWTLRTIPTAPI
jgi:hypothetical protein